VSCGKPNDRDAKFCVACGKKMVRRKGVNKKVASTDQKLDSNHLELRNRDKLSSDEEEFVLSPSISVFGPFNIFARGLWLIVGIHLLSNYLVEYDFEYWMWILILVGLGYFYFAIWKHGRRWAWNTNKWESLNAFKESERKWHPWGILGLVLIGLALAFGFIQGWYGI